MPFTMGGMGKMKFLEDDAWQLTREEPLMTCSGSFPILLSKLSQRSNLTLDLKSVTSITLISMLPF